MSHQIAPETIKGALARVIDTDTGMDVITAGLISGIAVRGGKVGFLITIAPEDKERKAYLRKACEAAVQALPGVGSVTAVLTAHRDEPIPPRPQSGYPQPRERANWNLTPVEGVRRIIAVASGKGGVGKSTTTINLALALRDAGQEVGVLDADIYGPSLPRMLGLYGKHTPGQPEIRDGKMQPLAAHGLRCMSMGFITGDEAAVLRGPMISKALHQMLRMTRWGSHARPLDLLLVDMPPGTGDIHLSLAQQAPLDGAAIITTPQAVATLDARKCLLMFQKVGVPVLGVIENMSGGLFGSGGGKKLAEEAGVPFLGAIGMDAAICEASDSGQAYHGTNLGSYRAIAGKLAKTG